jgi:hypothetical protein
VEQPPAELREDTMLYREPTDDSDEQAVQDIWGKRLEVMTVDASQVHEFLEAGWVTHPLDIGKSPEERAGFTRVAGSSDRELTETRLALETAEKLVDEQAKRISELEAEVKRVGDSLAAADEAALKVAGDLKAAEELADAETKAKEAALAQVAELTVDKGKPGKGAGNG